MFAELLKTVNHYVDVMGIPGNDFAVYHNGECVIRNTRGVSDYEGKTPMTGKERYNIYSASKLITCTTALKLFESGAFKLDDPLYAYMPEFSEMSVRCGTDIVKAKNVIKVIDLFRMTAGFHYTLSSPGILKAIEATGGRAPTRKVIEYFAEDPLFFEPGMGWAYSLCHDVLAAFVEVVSGMRFADYAKKNVFDPLGMTKTTYALPEDETDTIMAQYFYDKETKTYNKRECGKHIYNFKFGPEYDSGGAGCISCIDDYMKLEEALRVGDGILKEETVKLLTTNHLTDLQLKSFTNNSPRSAGYGYGLGCWCGIGYEDLNDFGWTGAAGAFHCVNRDLGYSAVYFEEVLGAPNFPTSIPLRALLYEAFRDMK